MRIDLDCPKCGKNRFDFPADGNDDAMITCVECGEQIGTLGELKQKVASEVLRHKRQS